MQHQIKEKRLKGIGLSSGVGVARVCLFNEQRHSNLPMYKVGGEGISRERERTERAVRLVSERLDKLHQDVESRLGKAEAEIFLVQKMLLEDETLKNAILDTITERECNAETAVNSVMDYYQEQLSEVDNEYMQGRTSDLDEVRRRLLDVLANMNPSLQCSDDSAHCQRGYNRIVVAEELTPSLTMELDTEHTIAFVTERGGINSHAAILAKALGIPAVSGIEGIHSTISCGTELLVDGDNGEIVVAPEEKTLQQVHSRKQPAIRSLQSVAPIAAMRVLASISRSSDIEHAVAMKAEGVGLYRTEFEFFAANRLLSEEEQVPLYTEVLKGLASGQPFYMRLLDVGADKPLPFLDFQQEENPALGYRGARFLLGNPEILTAQVRAAAKASREGCVSLMIPMVTGVEQFRKIKEIIHRATKDISGKNLQLGTMFEIPSACLEAEALLAEADFASIGSNDLVQYLFAVDRNNAYVAEDYQPDQPVFWQLVERIVEAGRNTGKPVSLCGEIAGDPSYVPYLLDRGVRILSVSPRLIPGVRLAVPSSE